MGECSQPACFSFLQPQLVVLLTCAHPSAVTAFDALQFPCTNTPQGHTRPRIIEARHNSVTPALYLSYLRAGEQASRGATTAANVVADLAQVGSEEGAKGETIAGAKKAAKNQQDQKYSVQCHPKQPLSQWIRNALHPVSFEEAPPWLTCQPVTRGHCTHVWARQLSALGDTAPEVVTPQGSAYNETPKKTQPPRGAW
eukprot:1137043-Pelagomonas_calceolata.AAC.8